LAGSIPALTLRSSIERIIKMQGVFSNYERVPTKKALKEALQTEPEHVELEATSLFGNEFGGPVLEMPEGKRVAVVGPDPYKKRNWYATLERTGNEVKVVE
jgi:hypothetical protein